MSLKHAGNFVTWTSVQPRCAEYGLQEDHIGVPNESALTWSRRGGDAANQSRDRGRKPNRLLFVEMPLHGGLGASAPRASVPLRALVLQRVLSQPLPHLFREDRADGIGLQTGAAVVGGGWLRIKAG